MQSAVTAAVTPLFLEVCRTERLRDPCDEHTGSCPLCDRWIGNWPLLRRGCVPTASSLAQPTNLFPVFSSMCMAIRQVCVKHDEERLKIKALNTTERGWKLSGKTRRLRLENTTRLAWTRRLRLENTTRLAWTRRLGLENTASWRWTRRFGLENTTNLRWTRRF